MASSASAGTTGARPASAGVWILAALASSACGISFDAPSQVLDRRVLALAAEPPEIVVGAGPLPAGVRLRALVADPAGVPPAQYEWSACVPGLGATGNVQAGAGVDPNSGRCSADETAVVATGTAPLDALDAVVPVPPALASLLGPAVANNLPVSLYVQAQLQLESSAGDLFAIKRLVVSPPLPAGRIANKNPVLRDLTLNGTSWPPGLARTVARDRCEPEDRESVVDPADPSRFTSACAWVLSPVFDDAQVESYQVQTFDGRVLDLRERLTFDWFADRGSFSEGSTAQNLPFGPQAADPLPTHWREPPGYTGPVRLWVVVRDGRGGVGWLERRIDLR